MEWIVEAESLSDFVDHGRYSISTKQLIRCKDCKHFATINEPYNETFCRLCFMNKSKKGYCDKAERRTDEQK